MINSTLEVRSTIREMIPRNFLWHFFLVAFLWIQVNPLSRCMHANAEPIVKNHSSQPVLRVVGRRAISAAACC